MTNKEFTILAKANQKQEERIFRSFLKNCTRFQLRKGKRSHPVKVHLITKNISLTEESRSDCFCKLSHVIEDILSCYPKIKELLNNHPSILANQKPVDVEGFLNKEVLEKLQKKAEKKCMSILSRQEIDDRREEFFDGFKDSLRNSSRNRLNLTSVVDFSEQTREVAGKNLKTIFEKLKEAKKEYDKDKRIPSFVSKVLQENSSEELRKVYEIDIRRVERDSQALGLYYHSGHIEIFLDPIYDVANGIGIEPYILYRIVLSHELAHAFHHRGIDENNNYWQDFGKRYSGRINVVEGLAQWHAMQSVLNLDLIDKQAGFKHTMAMLWFATHQPTPYQYFMKWINYSPANIRTTILHSRRVLLAGSAFDAELKKKNPIL